MISNGAIISELRLTYSTPATRRNIQDLTTPISLENAQTLSNQILCLAANNNDGNNSLSAITFGPVTTFIHLTTDQPVQLSMTDPVNGSSVTLQTTLIRYMVLTAAFSSVTITNTNTASVANLRAIYA